MKYKLVIFDFDGTLADSFPFFLKTINGVADEYKFKRVKMNELEMLRGFDAKQVMNHLGLPTWKVPLVANRLRKKMAENIEQVSMFEGVEKMLAALSDKGIKLSLITSNSSQNVSQVLNPQNMSRFVEPQCGTSLFGKRSKMKSILKKTGVAASETIYIGDEIRDLNASKAENIAFGAVSWGYTRIEVLKEHSPTEIFYRVEEIIEKIN